ncbi:hypothetical protein [Litchfieldia alkalitelluris]|uniref:hypothetical protein n=1 Tax=Litchfieldia alkalitelluris TaxID=304268 RepID=UPI00147644A1|nr:hypothetical protein [Litchfieldia alkalitelluris]
MKHKDSLNKKHEVNTIDEAEEILECETYFGKEFFWNELETIVSDGINNSEQDLS